jgi:UDP-N-acetylglucosamine--N-acetylmuramyl-(pentapeptide) pyrophosphoryl-undecaprenol N-acetylglucosamine transferase
VTSVLFAGGGTGGHLMPALAIARAMTALDRSVSPYFVGSIRGVEARVLPLREWPYELLPLEPLYRRKWWKNARLPLSLHRTLKGMRAVLKRERPVLVIGTGGYVSAPVVWAAMNRGIPAVLQEQNARPGLATRFLARRAAQVHLGFREAMGHLHGRGEAGEGGAAPVGGAKGPVLYHSGNPIEPPPSPKPDKGRAKRNLGFPPERPMVLVFGGSQGAAAINEAVSGALADGWPEAGLLWQTGPGTYGQFAERAETARVRVTAFIDPMADAYAAADLVVARAGAMSLAELCAWGLPSVLIPLPTAAANHQLENARAMEAAGASVLLEQRELTPARLAETVRGLLDDPARMAHMTSVALGRARADAATFIASRALELVPRS